MAIHSNGFEVGKDGSWRKWSQDRDGTITEQRGENYWGPRAETPCRVYWGSHGCCLERGHDGEHRCVCESCGYGPEARFFGEDA